MLDSEERFCEIFDQSIVPMGLIGLSSQVLKVTQACSNMLGYSIEEMVGKGWELFLHPDELNDTKERMVALYTGKVDGYFAETRYISKSGRTLWMAATLSTIHAEDGVPKYYIGILRDITETRRLSDQLSYQTSHDTLTGLINRHEFERCVERLLATIRQD